MNKIKSFLVLSLSTLILGSFFSCNNTSTTKKDKKHTITTADTIVKPKHTMFGLNLDSFAVESNTVKRNEFLSTILLKHNVSYSNINKLVAKSKNIFDIRKIKVNNPYYVFIKRDTLLHVKYFVYKIDKVNYVKYELGDSITVTKGHKKINTIEKTSAGMVTSSLWNAMKDNGASPILSMKLSEIYAWTVDFFGIGKGDYFKLLYNEDYVDSTSIGSFTIKGALFHHRGQNYYAFNFAEDSTTYNFFDEKGNSLRKAFLKAPLKYSRISSKFSNGRWHPVLKIMRPHHGVDYAAPRGTHVHAIGDGRIIAKGYQPRGGGNYLKIKHNSVYTTEYMHMNGFAKGIKTGVHVKQGQLIGYVGSTGLATGPHLDFRVFKNGTPINPLKVKAPPVNPIKKKDMSRFKDFCNSTKKQIDKLKL